MRVFLAFDISDEVKENAVNSIKRLKRSGGNVRWVKPENMHFTIKFFGEITEDEVENIDRVIKEHLKNFNKFKVKVSGINTFPPLPKNPRVVWAGIEYFEELERIHKVLIPAFQKIGFPEEYREFKPHLTLGRVKNTNGISGLKKAIEKNQNQFFGEFEIKTLILYKSKLTPEGPIYTVIHSYNLER